MSRYAMLASAALAMAACVSPAQAQNGPAVAGTAAMPMDAMQHVHPAPADPHDQASGDRPPRAKLSHASMPSASAHDMRHMHDMPPTPTTEAAPAAGATSPQAHAMHLMHDEAPARTAEDAPPMQATSPRDEPAAPPVHAMHHSHGMSTRPPAEDAPAARADEAPAGNTHDMQHMHGMPSTSAERPMSHTMGPMQGGRAPADARDPDYSDGIDLRATHGLGSAMHAERFGSVRLNQLEAFRGMHENGSQWELQASYGSDRDKLWLRSEGEQGDGRLRDADLEVLWSHAVAPFWDTQLGLRQDLGEGPDRRWAAFGVQGLAPYWFELELTGYVGPAGRTAARLRAEYELLLTQRLVLQPEFEANAYGKADPARGTGSGLADASLGLRLRYEIRREFAPYAGLVWTRRFGAGAAEGRTERRWVAGVRLWF